MVRTRLRPIKLLLHPPLIKPLLLQPVTLERRPPVRIPHLLRRRQILKHLHLATMVVQRQAQIPGFHPSPRDP